MEKKNQSQLDLFSAATSFSEVPGSGAKKGFFSHILGYEKIILLTIGFAITAIVSFCLGVQRGKETLIAKLNTRFEVAKIEARPQQQLTQTPVLTQAFGKQKVPQLAIPGNYTIQIASYQTREEAQKELSNLRKKSLAPLVFSKGKFIIICVGNFSSKEKAIPLLTELKKQYKDCYLRRI